MGRYDTRPARLAVSSLSAKVVKSLGFKTLWRLRLRLYVYDTPLQRLVFPRCPQLGVYWWGTSRVKSAGSAVQSRNTAVGRAFQWSGPRSFAIVGISTHGRTMVARVPMIHPNLVRMRCRLAALDILWRVEAFRDRGSLGHHFCRRNRCESFDYIGCESHRSPV
jgi:hypothetical protein